MFCKTCGNQLTEGAHFCLACGAEIVPLPSVEPALGPVKKPAEEPMSVATTAKKESTASLIFAFVFKVFAILSATFCGCALAEGWGWLTYSEIQRELYNNYATSTNAITDGLHVHLLWEETCATIALIAAIAVLTLALGWLIYTIAKRRQCQYILSAITWVLAAGGLLAVSICLAS